MKAKVYLKKYLGYYPTSSIDDTVEVEISESIFDKITTKNKPTVIPMYYATLDDKIISNYNNKKTYTSEKKLLNGIAATLTNNIDSYALNIANKGYNEIKVDIDDLINKLLDSGRLKIHKLETTKI